MTKGFSLQSERAAELQALLEGLQQKMNAAGSALAGAESSLASKSEELERIKVLSKLSKRDRY